jgi:glycosyltransferase involved in cell wall biosynthesis|nr:glycosyltransferase family 4 protein [uncultured Flavobacterium sp.]
MEIEKNVKQKVLIGIPCLLTGGTEYQTINLVRALKEAGHRVITACYYEYDPKMVSLFESYGSEVILFSTEGNSRPTGFKAILFILKNIRQVVNSYKPGLIHIQYMAPGAIPIFTARLAGVKKVLATVHQPHTKSHGIFSKIMLRISALFCTAFIVVSKNAEVSWFGSSSLYDNHKALSQQPSHFTVYNAIDIIQIQELALKVDTCKEKEAQQIPSKSFVFGAVSRLRAEKGIDLLLQAFSRLVADNHEVHLHIVGTGPDEKELKTLVAQLNITDKVTFFGEAIWESAMQQMALMDVVVVPSRFEGFGLSAAEAMAMGKPVVASNVFGLKEVVSDGQTGLLFENGDSSDLYLKLLRFCIEKTPYSCFSHNALVYVNQFGLPEFNKKVTTLHNIS